MANDLTRFPWYIDTAAVITTAPIRPAVVRWVDAGGSAGDTVVIQDNPPAQPDAVKYGTAALAPRTVMTLIAPEANWDSGNQRFEKEMQPWNGLKVLSISGGHLEITPR